MLQFLESPLIIWLTIMFFFLFFFVLFLTKLPRTNGKNQTNTDVNKKAKESRSECTMFGFLKKLPKDDPIPNECMTCRKLVECLMKKRAFDWYVGQDSVQAK